MSSLATRRLIDATASLEEADRALLSLWVNRGLDDERLAALAAIPIGTLHARRNRIVERLSDELGLAPEIVRATLDELSITSRQAAAEDRNGTTQVQPTPPDGQSVPPDKLPRVANGSAVHAGAELAGLLAGPAAAHRTAPTPTLAGLLLGPAAARKTTPTPTPAGLLLGPAAARKTTPTTTLAGRLLGPAAGRSPGPDAAREPAPPDAAPEPAQPDAPLEPLPPARRPAGRHRGLWIAAAMLVVVLLGVAIAALASGGGAKPHRAVVTAAPSPTTTAAVVPTLPNPAPAAPRPTAGGRVTPLRGLPGGLGDARGSVQLAGPGNDLRLRLTVIGLPVARDGHYEVWLYNSVLDSRPLGRLGTGVHPVSYGLPGQARRYRWIDISFQPVGAVNHSGESQLRAVNPAHATRVRH
jgi:hypothetical protein